MNQQASTDGTGLVTEPGLQESGRHPAVPGENVEMMDERLDVAERMYVDMAHAHREHLPDRLVPQ